MLTRIRIEVEGEDSAAACEEALTKYEHALQVLEAGRYGQLRKGSARGEEAEDLLEGESPYEANVRQLHAGWGVSTVERGFYNEELGREVTDEVIEFVPDHPGYRGRRVVQYRRLDTRSIRIGEPGTEGSSLTVRGTHSSISLVSPNKAE
jgi:hypothetical protein